MREASTLVSIFLGLALLGCSRLEDVKRCRELTARVNGTFDAVERELVDGGSPAALNKAAGKYRELARKLEDFEEVSPGLDKAVSELASLSRSTGRQVSALATALEAKNPTSETLATRELEHLAKQQKTLAQRIDDECRPK